MNERIEETELYAMETIEYVYIRLLQLRKLIDEEPQHTRNYNWLLGEHTALINVKNLLEKGTHI
jgi:hypothetical protein